MGIHAIRRATTVAEVAAAEHLFDHPVRTEWAERFLTAGGHHLFLAYADGEPAPDGFVSGVETVHPDKGTEMFRTGPRARLLRHVGADRHRNDVALATCRSVGGKDDGTCSVMTWGFTE
ncbi:GNAT family N-acetyltransferase [Streptomyces sp. NBC_00203]